jgi:hypothetical protein
MHAGNRRGSGDRRWRLVLRQNRIGSLGAVGVANGARNRRRHAPIDRLDVERVALPASALNLDPNWHGENSEFHRPASKLWALWEEYLEDRPLVN